MSGAAVVIRCACTRCGQRFRVELDPPPGVDRRELEAAFRQALPELECPECDNVGLSEQAEPSRP